MVDHWECLVWGTKRKSNGKKHTTEGRGRKGPKEYLKKYWHKTFLILLKNVNTYSQKVHQTSSRITQRDTQIHIISYQKPKNKRESWKW